MIKFKADLSNGRKLFGLGIDASTIEHLKEGKPITVDLDKYNVEGVDFFMCYGEDTAKLIEMLKHLIGPQTIVTDDRGDGELH